MNGQGSVSANLWKLNLIRLLFWTHFISAVLIPFYRDWGGLTYTQILLVNAWFMVWNFLLEIPTGTVADVLGRRASLVLGALVGVVAALVYVSSPALPRFLFAEILFAGSFTLMSGADEAMLYDTLRDLGRTDEATRRFGLLASSQQAGIVLGALLGGVIAGQFGLRAPLALQTIPMALAGVVAFTLVEPTVSRRTERPRFRAVLTVGIETFLRHPVLRVLAFDMVTVGALAWAIIWLYQPLLEGVGIGIAWFGVAHSCLSLGQILFLSQLDRLQSVLGRRRLLAAGPLALGVSYWVLGTSTSAPVTCIAILAAAALGLSRPPLFVAWMNPHIDSHHRATVLSVVAMFRTLAIAIVNPVAGWMADHSLPMTMRVLGTASLLIAFLSPVGQRHLEPPARTAD